jgi:hypothetical protein
MGNLSVASTSSTGYTLGTTSSTSSSKKSSSSTASKELTLTASEVADYLKTNSFCSLRTEDTASVTDILSTTSLTQTLKLLSGSSKNLDKVLANLKEMKKVATGITDSSTTAERNEAYAKLRSLAAGMDTILTKTTFNGNELFDGTQLDLSGAGQYNRTVLDNLKTTGSQVGLATSSANAEVQISYDDFCKWNNAMVNLEGLDISKASTCKVSGAASELENGKYVVKVSYAGPKSTVSILNSSGDLVSKQDDVDLSGSGVTSVSMDCGVQLTFDKTQVAGSAVDKYDYADNGPAVLYADLNYTRVNSYNLAGSQTAKDRSVNTVFKQGGLTDAEGGTFSLGDAGLGTLDDKKTELSAGTYRVEVYKTGDKASAIMYNNTGKLVGTVSSVSLNTNGSTSLDFGNGISLGVNNSNYADNGTLVTTLDYTPAVNTYDNFDFAAYEKKIESAVKTVTEQQNTLDEATNLSTTVQKALNGTLSSSVNSLSSQLVTTLLGNGSSSTSATSLLSGTSSSGGGLSWATSLITSNLSAALGLSTKADTSLSSLLGGTVKSLNPVTLPNKVSVTA